MRIGVDARPLREKQISGIPAYVRNVLSSLGRLDRDNEYFLYAPQEMTFQIPNERWHLRSGGVVPYGTLWMQTDIPFYLKRDKIDVFWGTQHVLPLISKGPVKMVLTMLDLIYSVHPETMQFKNKMINRLLIPPSVNKADAIVTISQWTMDDINRIIKPRKKLTDVTYMAAGEQYHPRPKPEAQSHVFSKFKFNKPYILSVGAFEPRKNLGRVVEAFGRASEKIEQDLVIVGPDGWKNQSILRKLTTSKVRNRIHHVGYVSNEDLPYLYAGADAFVFASIYEGFGIPPLEAMACGIPVISSNASSLPEVVGDAARMVDPFSVDDIEAALVDVCTNENRREQMRVLSLKQAKKFSWDQTARQMIRIFDTLHVH